MKIETIELDEVSIIRSRLQKRVVETVDEYSFPLPGKVSLVLRAYLQSEDKFHQLRELCTNKHFSTTYVENQGIFTIVRATFDERGGYPNLWTIDFELNKSKQKWDLIWEDYDIPTSWDLYEDEDFDGLTNPPTDWTYTGGTRSIVDDAGQEGAGDDVLKWEGTGTKYFAYFDRPYHVNCGIEADVWFYDNSNPGIIAKYIDNNYYYVFYLGSNMVVLQRAAGGSPTTIRQWSKDIDFQTWYKLKMEFEHPFIHCYFDGEYLGTVYDGTLLSGWAGLYCLNSTNYSYYNNVAYWPLRSNLLAIPPNYDQLSEYELTTRSSAYGTIGICRPHHRFNVSYKLDDVGELIRVYDDKGTVTESEWSQVFNRDRWFEDNMIMENGLVRVKYEV